MVRKYFEIEKRRTDVALFIFSFPFFFFCGCNMETLREGQNNRYFAYKSTRLRPVPKTNILRLVDSSAGVTRFDL